VVLLAAAYLAGYLPQRSQRVAAESEVGTLTDRLAASESRGRISALLGRALAVKDAAARQNYGQAQELASAFFDQVRAELAVAADAGARDALTEILSRRDAVTASLSKADAGVIEVLRAIELRLRGALGYPLA
jgi:hypothetical protein